MEKFTAALERSRRPLVVTGLGFCRSQKPRALLRFIEAQKIPFISTLHAKGFLPESHPHWAGVLGRARRSDVQAFIAASDLIVAVGFDPIEINYEEWTGRTPLVHLGQERADAGAEVALRLDVAGDIDAIIARLGEIPPLSGDWAAAAIKAQREKLEMNLRPACAGLAPHHVIDRLRKNFPPTRFSPTTSAPTRTVIATQWRADFPDLLATNGWSRWLWRTCAYAAKMVHPERTVFRLVGDGCQ